MDAHSFDAPNEDWLTNDIVTVSQLQIALRAEARSLQSRLSELSLQADTRTDAGLFALLQQAADTLLEYNRFWTHVYASSQTADSRSQAESLFQQLSWQERQKFGVESLSNVDGVVAQQPLPPRSPTDQADYIVVTLLLGTADDQPLFTEIYSSSMLRDVLEEIVTMRSPNLMVFELLWTPQDARDSLSATELKTDYAYLVSIE